MSLDCLHEKPVPSHPHSGPRVPLRTSAPCLQSLALVLAISALPVDSLDAAPLCPQSTVDGGGATCSSAKIRPVSVDFGSGGRNVILSDSRAGTVMSQTTNWQTTWPLTATSWPTQAQMESHDVLEVVEA